VTEEYRVAIKPSAWQRSRAIGEWVNREGPRRVFASKALAREWARSCSGHGVHLWVQDAPDRDEQSVDGYLVGGARGTRRDEDETEQGSLDVTVTDPD
jgi:hypothetical protein